jgi:hypothetical protein
MNIVISFDTLNPNLTVSLPEESKSYEVLAAWTQAAVDEGKRHIVHLLFESELAELAEQAAQVPRHGVIVFSSTEDDELSVNAEGPWWLYTKPTPLHVQGSVIAFKVLSNVFHLVLTVKP